VINCELTPVTSSEELPLAAWVAITARPTPVQVSSPMQKTPTATAGDDSSASRQLNCRVVGVDAFIGAELTACARITNEP